MWGRNDCLDVQKWIFEPAFPLFKNLETFTFVIPHPKRRFSNKIGRKVENFIFLL